MAFFRNLFYRKPPDHLLEICNRVYVFDCCFSSENLEEDEYKEYMNNILVQLQSYFPDASFRMFNFREGQGRNLVAEILARYNISVIEYPHRYHGCPLLPLEMIYKFLDLCANWLSSEGQQNVLLMHCERGGWPVLSFMLSCLMIYRSQSSGEERTLEMMYKQAPRELFQMFSHLNPFPSHLRYLHYITGKDNVLQWPLCDVPYSLDCLILQDASFFDGKEGFRPIVRVYGRDPSNPVDEGYRVVFTSLENKEQVHNFRQADCSQITLDVHCSIQGDVVLECIHMDEHLELEEMVFRIMFNTTFVQNNVMLLNSEEIDIIWGMEDQFRKNFKAEVIFSEFDVGSNTPQVVAIEEDEVEAEEFFEAEEIFSNPDLHDGTRDHDIHSTPIKVHDRSLPELVSDHDETENSSLEFDHTIHSLRNGLGQAMLILDDPNALPEYEGQRVDKENSDMIVETHVKDATLVEDNAFITSNLRNAFNNNPDDKKVICSTVSVDEAKRSLEIKVSRHYTETNDIVGQSLQDSSPEFRTPKMADLSQYTNRIPYLADDGRSMSEMKGLIKEVEFLNNPDTQKAFDGGALGNATSQLEIIHADQPEVSFKNEEPVKVEFPGNCNLLCPEDNAKKNHYFEAEEHTILVSNGLKQASKGNREVISCDMTQNFRTPLFCNERRSSESENSYRNIGTDFNMKPIHDSQGQGAQSGNSEIVDWLEHQEASHNCIKDEYASQNNALLESSCENKEVHVHRKEHEEQLPAASQKQSTVETSDPVTVAQKGKLLLSAGDNEQLVEPQIVIMQTSVRNDTEDNHVNLSSFPSTNNGLLPQSSLAASPPPPPPPPPPLPPSQYIHLPSSSLVSRSNRSINHISSLPYRENCEASPPPPIPPCSEKQSASELLASYLPPLLPIKVNSPTKSLSTTLAHSPFTVMKYDFELLVSQFAFSPLVEFQHSVKCPMTGSLYSSAPSLPPSLLGGNGQGSTPPSHGKTSSPPPPPPPLPCKRPVVAPSPPPPPPPSMLSKAPNAPPPPPSSGLRGPPPPLGPMPGGGGLGFARTGVPSTANKKSSLKPLHWIKVTRAIQGSLWADLQKHADAHSTTEFDILELETLFSAVVINPDSSKSEGRKSITKSDKVNLIDLRRANNTEIMLTQIKMRLPDMMNAALALDESILDGDQVENLIKLCPTKEDMELLENYTGDKENLGKCEQFYLELMKVPRVEAKLRVFCFKIQFNAQTADIRKSLYAVDSACEEIRTSNKLKEIMKTILCIGNTLNQGTARGAAIGFRLDSLLKLADTRAVNNKTTLMHYLCMVLCSKSPHLMDFHEDLISLEAASKIQLKALAEEQQGVVKRLSKVEMELIASESDGVVSEVFCKTLKDFTVIAGAEVRSLTALHNSVGKNADGLALYFGEDPAHCPFEQVITTLSNFVRLFRCAHEENCKEAELEKKKTLKAADTCRPNLIKKHDKR